MKVKEGLVLRYVDGMPFVVALGELSAKFNGMISLNETGAVLWKALTTDTDVQTLVDVLQAEYQVDAETAQKDVTAFLSVLREAKFLEE